MYIAGASFPIGLTIRGSARPYSWPDCKELVRTGPVEGRASPWGVWRDRRPGPPAWWLPAGWRARGSSWIAPRPGPRSVGWTPGRTPSLSFSRGKSTTEHRELCKVQQQNWIWSQWTTAALTLSFFFTGGSEPAFIQTLFPLPHWNTQVSKTLTHNGVTTKPDKHVFI